jgi:hypothetical protein
MKEVELFAPMSSYKSINDGNQVDYIGGLHWLHYAESSFKPHRCGAICLLVKVMQSERAHRAWHQRSDGAKFLRFNSRRRI